jgi:hypothetical protein
MNVYRITEAQKDQVIGQTWGYQGQLFNPTLDADSLWFLSQEEVLGCTYAQATALGIDSWLLTLTLVPHNPVVNELP